ncbi:sugar phosphate isomerase/epimerase [Streptomyces sp. ODS28]|uniref:sugar phosphate isomerase/epimerase family protein n=1 Tax=Streptomyces sp. ODS28 TaxID=3136688 RepID=UPI0031E5F147
MPQTAPSAALSVQLYSVRDALAADRDGTLKRLAALGYRYVEPFGLGDWRTPPAERAAQARALRDALDAAGLGVSSLHAALAEGDPAPLAEECRILGADTVFVPVPELVQGFEREVFEDPARLAAFAGRLNAAARGLADHGVRLGYHNHEFEWVTLPGGRTGYEAFWEHADDLLLAELDVYWATVAGQDPAALLRGLGARAVAVHVKDGPARRGAPQTPLGTGDVDVPAALAAAPQLTWHIAEIDTTDEDVFTLLERNRAALLAQGRTTA